jgi:iron complex outermembrane receptor protein
MDLLRARHRLPWRLLGLHRSAACVERADKLLLLTSTDSNHAGKRLLLFSQTLGNIPSKPQLTAIHGARKIRMNSIRTCRFVSLILIVTANLVLSQPSRKDTLEFKYPEVVVTGSRMTLPLKEIPFSTSVVGPEVVQTLPRSVSMDEPLKLVPGVKVDNQSNGSRVHLSIRGQGILTERGIRGIKILLDGLPLNDPTGFAPDCFDIDFSTLERIEVLRGPAASIYGGSASGGIINIATQNPPDAPLFGDAEFTGGSNGFWKAFGQFGGTAHAINYRVSVSRTMGDGYRDHTHFWSTIAYGKATWTPTSDFQLTPIFIRSETFHENPEGITLDQYRQDARQANPDAIPFNEYLSTNRTTFGTTGSLKMKNNQSLDFGAYVKGTLFTEANNRTFNHRTITTPGGSLQYTLRSGERDAHLRNTVSVGADVQWQSIDEHRVDNLHAVEGDTIRSREEIRQSGAGLFVLDKLSIGSTWGVMACLRYDNIHNELQDLLKSPFDLSGNADFSKTTSRIGFTYSPQRNVTMFGSWGQGFMPPATEELAQNPDHFGGFNTHLTSATSEGFEVGVRHMVTSQLRYEFTGFSLVTANDFDRYRIPDPLRNQETFYRNSASSRRTGAEVFMEFLPDPSFDLQLAYTFSAFQYTNSQPIQVVMDDPAISKFVKDGNWLPNSPKHQFSFDLRYTLSSGLAVGLSGEAMSKTYIDGANIEAEAADGYALLHARLSYDLSFAGHQVELRFQVRNIADKEYIAFTEPDPGGNAYQPAARREVFGGMRVHF